MRSIFLIFIALVLSGASPKSEAEQAFDEWLIAFNANDAEALKTFSEKRLGYSDITYFLDLRDESGGLDLAKIERNQPHRFIAIMLDRESQISRRVTVELEAVGSTKVKKLTARGLPTSQKKAIEALDAFAQRMADEDRFSGVLGIKQGQKLIYQRAFGMANRQQDIPVTSETPFFFASQGKMFTAVSVLQLVEAGKLNLNDPLGKYLTDYPNKEMAKVTIRQLLTHRGGTGEMGLLGPQDGVNRKKLRTLGGIIKLNGNRPPAFEPGSRMDYSNYGFILLGAIIEKVSGKDYYDYVTERVLKPARMNKTGWPTLDELTNVAVPYTTSKDKYLVSAIETLPWRGSPAGGGVSTLVDELRFVEALRAGKILSLPLLQEAIKPQEEWYGYGFVTGYSGGFPQWGHGGGAPGTSTFLYFFPKIDTTIACLGNRDAVCDKLFQNFAQHIIPPKPIKD
ncbi:Beta-lactamase class C-like and penicillin binding proteins (PBPs) superfamily [hydrothermal vent metagenome]|uniref:Beta-lactamase class C-like and penicillin binding proteins (PBPs) superfamily n=1 Tax=hydrothermal vent metagenome TaxID=652676 RepID=A0A3B0RNG7_9ZZZZ